MSDYTPPGSNNIPFKFSSSGYSPPNFDDVSFAFSKRTISTDTASLSAAVDVMQLYQNSTYTYVKECKKIITGYSNRGIQTLSIPCLYGGIRDLLIDIRASRGFESDFTDLAALIKTRTYAYIDLITAIRVKSIGTSDFLTAFRYNYRNTDEFSTVLRPSITSTTELLTYSYPIKERAVEVNLPFFTRPTIATTLDLITLLRIPTTLTKTFRATLYPVLGREVIVNLATTLTTIPPADFKTDLNVIELRDLISNVTGVYFKGESTLPAEFGKVTFLGKTDFSVSMYSWDSRSFSTFLKAYSIKDLSATVFPGHYGVFKDISSIISCVLPMDLSASIHSYATANLTAFTIIGFQPNDLQAHVFAIKPRDLNAFINAKLGIAISRDLPSYVQGYHTRILEAYIETIESKNLPVYIDAVGKYLNLRAQIAPRTINIKSMLYIPLMEHANLRATIGYNCLKSSFRDFYVHIGTINKLDLRGYILGWSEGVTDNILDLNAFINYTDYTVQNYITISGSPIEKHNVVQDVRSVGKSPYKVFDSYVVSGGAIKNNIYATITGILRSRDLNATLVAKPIANFTTVPSWVNPSTLEVVLNINRFEERWTRFVEMLFFTSATEDFHYFYVSGEDKIYKVDRERTWKIKVIGFDDSPDNIYSRRKVSKKFIFKLTDYTDIDSAIKDYISRVTLLRSHDLSAYIQTTEPNYQDLDVSITTKFSSSWSSSFKTTLLCIYKKYSGFDVIISPEVYKGSNNLTASIVGKSYEPPPTDNITFTFKDPGYISPTSYVNVNWTYIQAEEFWKEDEE